MSERIKLVIGEPEKEVIIISKRKSSEGIIFDSAYLVEKRRITIEVDGEKIVDRVREVNRKFYIVNENIEEELRVREEEIEKEMDEIIGYYKKITNNLIYLASKKYPIKVKLLSEE